MNRIVVNTRTLYGPFSGIQRYTSELLQRFGPEVDQLKPARKPEGLQNIFWDQIQLPSKRQGRLLWSPDSTGPLWVADQVVTIHDVIPLTTRNGLHHDSSGSSAGWSRDSPGE